jgi:hypothetical protein
MFSKRLHGSFIALKEIDYFDDKGFHCCINDLYLRLHAHISVELLLDFRLEELEVVLQGLMTVLVEREF